jgi:hypothetical protein
MAIPPKPHPYASPLEKRPRFVRAIGMISIENASLESMLGELLGALLGIFPSLGHTLYFTPKAVLARLEMLENVMVKTLDHDPKTLARVTAVVKRSRALMGKRNDIMHSLWAISEERGSPVARILFPSWKGGDVKLTELTDIIRDYRNLTGETAELIDVVQASYAARMRALRRTLRRRVPGGDGPKSRSPRQSSRPAKR